MWQYLVASLAAVGTAIAVAVSSSSEPKPPGTPDPIDPPDPTPKDPIPVDPTALDLRPPTRDAFGVLYARAGATPLWPIAGDRRSRTPSDAWARGRVSTDFGDGRPFGSASPSRHHAGEDLRAPRGTPLVATERGIVVGIDEEWYRNGAGTMTGATYVALDNGLVLNYGEVEPGSTRGAGLSVGDVVERGAIVGRVGATLMVHFETYVAGTRHSEQWAWGQPAPARLLDPTEYLQLAAATVPA